MQSIRAALVDAFVEDHGEITAAHLEFDAGRIILYRRVHEVHVGPGVTLTSPSEPIQRRPVVMTTEQVREMAEALINKL